MHDKRSSAALPTLAALVMITLLLSVYVGGYFLLSRKLGSLIVMHGMIMSPPDGVHRVFRHSGLTTVYQPAAFVEARVRKTPVRLHGEGAINFKRRQATWNWVTQR
jgi:hypothetical protein